MEEKRVLLDESGRPMPAFRRVLPVVDAVDGDASPRRRAKPEQHCRERGFAGAARTDDGHGLSDRDRELDVCQRRRAVWIGVADVFEAQRVAERRINARAKRALRIYRRIEPHLHLANPAGQVQQVSLQAVQLVEQRQQPQQHESVCEQVAAQHVPRPDEENIRAADDQHGADHRQRFGEREQQRGGVRASFFGTRLRGAEGMEIVR